MPLILELEAGVRRRRSTTRPSRPSSTHLNTHYAGRPSPLYFAERLTRISRFCGSAGRRKIYFKRDELNHTGSHKINNCLGQILLARRMGKTRIIAETGAGQHGVAAATVSARFGLPCVVYMGATDIERQKPNVFRMRLLGAEVRPVTAGQRHAEGRHERGAARLGDQCRDTYYLIGTAAGPHPYPEMVRDFQSVIGTRGARADPRAGGPAAGRDRRLRRRRLQRHRPVPPLPRRPRGRRSSASRPAATGSTSRTATPPR